MVQLTGRLTEPAPEKIGTQYRPFSGSFSLEGVSVRACSTAPPAAVSPTEIGCLLHRGPPALTMRRGRRPGHPSRCNRPAGTRLRGQIATDFGVNQCRPDPGEVPHKFPGVTVNMVANQPVCGADLRGFDMAIRVGELEDSSLRARKLCETQPPDDRRAVLFPALRPAAEGRRPEAPQALGITPTNAPMANVWKITAPSGEQRQVRTGGWLTVNDGQSR